MNETATPQKNINLESKVLKNMYEINKLFMKNINILSLNRFFAKDNIDDIKRIYAYINMQTGVLMQAIIKDNFNEKDANLLLDNMYIEITTRLTDYEKQSGLYKIH